MTLRRLTLPFALSLIVFAVTNTGCQLGRTKFNSQTPYIPYFAEVQPATRSKSNPYWTRFTAYGNHNEMKLNTGDIYQPPSPLLMGALGTHYRFKNDVYAYVMTGGLGAQYDFLFFERGKIAATGWAGFDKGVGLLVGASYKLGTLFNGDVVGYLSVQRREALLRLKCLSECIEISPVPNNQLEARQDIFEALAGVELGRFKIGDKGNTTLNFQWEAGIQRVLSSRVIREDYPSDFRPNALSFVSSVYADFTLW